MVHEDEILKPVDFYLWFFLDDKEIMVAPWINDSVEMFLFPMYMLVYVCIG